MNRFARLLAVLALAASSVAADPKVTAVPAFGGTARDGRWTAVRVEIENPDAEIKVQIRLTSGGVVSARDVVVPAGSRHGYWIPVRAGRNVDCIVTGPKLDATIPQRFLLSGGGERLFLAVSEALVGLPEHELWKSVLASGADLPDFSDAYEAFDAVIVRFPNPGLPGEAADAIRRWTENGGVLAVCAGMAAKEARDSRLGGVLPVEIAGTKEVRSLAEIDAGLPAVEGTFPVADVSARPGADPAPFGASGAAGLGRALFVGFDPLQRPVADWPGLASFWKVQLPLRPNPPADTDPPLQADEAARRTWLGKARSDGRVAEEAWNRGEKERLQRAGGLALAGRTVALGWFFVLLVVYLIVIGPLDYFVLKALRRQAWTWVTLPVAIAAFCGAAWAMSARTKARDSHIVAVGTIDVYPDGIRESALYLVVAPLSGNQEISTNSPDARLWPAGPPAQGQRPDLPEVAWGPRPAARMLPVHGWDPYPVFAASDLPPGAFSARFVDGRLVIQAPSTLRSCRLEAGMASRDGGDIAPGGTFPGKSAAPPSAEDAAFLSAVQKWFRENIRADDRGVLRLAPGTEQYPVLVGWIDCPAAAPVLGGEPPARSCFMVRFHLEKAP